MPEPDLARLYRDTRELASVTVMLSCEVNGISAIRGSGSAGMAAVCHRRPAGPARGQANWVSDRMLPSGSGNHATRSPLGVVQMPALSWSMLS